MRLSAKTAWFTLNLNGRTDFQVYSFHVTLWNGEKCVDDTNYFDANLKSEVAYTEKYEFWELK